MKTTSDENGNYGFLDVKIGTYSITCELAGFEKFQTSGINVDVGTRQRVEITMTVGQASQVVNVEGAASTLETDSSEKGQVINSQQVVELPLNGRNYADLALLAANVHKSPIATLFSPSGTPREASFNVNGMRSTYNNFLLDGIDNNAYSTSNQGYSSQVVQASPDAIAEFKVITSNFSAEYGRVGGGVINAALRAGTNQFHGTAYEFIRNTDLNAVGFTFSPAVFQKPTLQRNQFGFTLGGPIIKNKLFFFADYEGYRQLQRYLNFDTIPDATDRAGILPVSVYDPLNKTLYPANTQIPISALNPFAQAVLSQLPAPNGPGRSNNYEALLLIRDYSDKYDAKLDYQINEKMTSFLRFSQRKDLQYYQPDIAGPSGGAGNGYIHAIQQQAAAGYTWTLTPTSLLDARFAFTHVLAGKEPPYLGGPGMQALYGISGLPTSPSLTGGLDSQSVSGFSMFGRQTSNPQFQNPTTFNPKLNYSLILGKHALKMGYEFMEPTLTAASSANPIARFSDSPRAAPSPPIPPATTSQTLSSDCPAPFNSVTTSSLISASTSTLCTFRTIIESPLNSPSISDCAGNSPHPYGNAITTGRISIPLPIPWLKPPTAASITDRWYIPITKTSVRGSGSPGISLPKPSSEAATALVTPSSIVPAARRKASTLRKLCSES